jgi:NAD(P)H-flavin reductase/ferredoxin
MVALRKLSRTARVNGKLVPVSPGETLLQAVLAGGLDFPNSCRVGGCATCKCRLVSGEVSERTETGYLLSAEELDAGYILACQSVPRTDVEIEVELSPHAARAHAGTIVAQQPLTHDITRLTVQLDEPMTYKAGQFANLSVEALPGVSRPYSFATPPRRGGQGSEMSDVGDVSFTIRKVPGGQLSTVICDEELIGKRAQVSDAQGDFWLRPGSSPLILIAGGSGLSPILAMLEDAAETGCDRSVTLLFGAREERDLYALAQIERLSRRWQGRFRFVPVLSAAGEGSTWTGARGLVTEEISRTLEPGAHAYLCGPPAMIDAAVEALRRAGVAREHIRFDRFTTQADAAKAEDARSAPASLRQKLTGSLHYLKFFSFHLLGLIAATSLVAGGAYITATLLGVLALYVLGDAFAGDDTSTPKLRHAWLLTAQLWLALPLLSLIVFLSVWNVSPGDPLGFGAWISGWSGHDALSARAATTTGHHVSAWILTGLMIGMVGTIPAHELTHRTWDPISLLVGRWLLAFSFDTTFAIEHVYGHHRYVSTVEDPATAPRGRNVYAHILISTIRGNVSAWKIEASRLAKKKRRVFSPRNAFLRGHLMSAVLVAAAYAMGGGTAVLYFVACALWGKSLLEIVNYMEHYGMVRNPEQPVQPHHSWNTNRRVSSWTMFNLTRHSHHHAQGEVAYQDLRPYPDAPMMINGYLTTLVIAMIPPLWHHLMTPKVLAWDRDFATAEEQLLASRANARSGLRAV